VVSMVCINSILASVRHAAVGLFIQQARELFTVLLASAFKMGAGKNPAYCRMGLWKGSYSCGEAA